MKAEYRPEYVRHLIEGYAALSVAADTTRKGLRYLVEKADLDRALARLPTEYLEVVVAHGLFGAPQEAVALVLRKSQSWVNKRYRIGLEDVHHYINGGD